MLYDPSSVPPPAPDLKDKILAAAKAQPSPGRREIRLRNVVLLAIGAGFLAEVFYWYGGLKAGFRPGALILETAVGAACIAAVVSWAALGQGRSMLGRSRIFLGVLGVGTPAALLAWKLFWSAQTPGAMLERYRFIMGVGPEGPVWLAAPKIGYVCLRMSLMMAIFPLLAMVLMKRNSDPNHPRATGASLGVAAGACAWVFTDLWCEVGYLPHLLIGHVLPIAILALLGALLGHLLISVRR